MDSSAPRTRVRFIARGRAGVPDRRSRKKHVGSARAHSFLRVTRPASTAQIGAAHWPAAERYVRGTRAFSSGDAHRARSRSLPEIRELGVARRRAVGLKTSSARPLVIGRNRVGRTLVEAARNAGLASSHAMESSGDASARLRAATATTRGSRKACATSERNGTESSPSTRLRFSRATGGDAECVGWIHRARFVGRSRTTPRS